MMRYNSYQNIVSSNDLGVAVFMWFAYVLVVIVLILSALALWKYINKK